MSTMTLNLPQTYIEVEKEEMQYVDGVGKIPWTCFDSGAVCGAIGAAIAGQQQELL